MVTGLKVMGFIASGFVVFVLIGFVRNDESETSTTYKPSSLLAESIGGNVDVSPMAYQQQRIEIGRDVKSQQWAPREPDNDTLTTTCGDLEESDLGDYERLVTKYGLPFKKLQKLRLMDLPESVLSELAAINSACEAEIDNRFRIDRDIQSMLFDEEIEACMRMYARKKDYAVYQYSTADRPFSKQFE